MLSSQDELNFSPYAELYDKIIPKDNLLRRINENIDFSFILEELKAKPLKTEVFRDALI